MGHGSSSSAGGERRGRRRGKNSPAAETSAGSATAVANDASGSGSSSDDVFLGVSTAAMARILQDPRFKSGMTTTDVCMTIIKPDTAAAGSSYAAMLRRDNARDANNQPLVGPATVFISHAWAYSFERLLDAVSFFATEAAGDAADTKTPVKVWLDLMVVDQNNAIVQPHDWWSSTFKTNIQKMGHVAAVMLPFDAPLNLTRAWVLWELFCAISTECTLSLILPPDDYPAFRQRLGEDMQGMLAAIEAIDAEQSQAFNPHDRDQIFEAIRADVGFAHVNSVVRRGLLGVYLCGVTRGVVKGTHTLQHMDDLVAAGARLDQIATELTALAVAASANNVDAVNLLLKAGATVDQTMMGGNSALHIAARDGAADVVRVLLEHKADAALRNRAGKTPAEEAAAVLAILEGSPTTNPSPSSTPAGQAEWTEFGKELASLRAADISELKSFAKPPGPLRRVVNAMCIILNIGRADKPDELWDAAKRELFGSIAVVRERLEAVQADPKPLDDTRLAAVQAELADLDVKALPMISRCGMAFYLFVVAALASQGVAVAGAAAASTDTTATSDSAPSDHSSRISSLKAVLDILST